MTDTGSTTILQDHTGTAELFTDNPLLCNLIDNLPQHVMLLNSDRQIVYVNAALREFARANSTEIRAGLRPGELFSCDHSLAAEHGCGTAASCRTCGALTSILAALDGDAASSECTIVRKKTNSIVSLDFRVWAAPFHIGGTRFVLVVATDVTAEIRLQLLEKTFLHDIRNTALSINFLTGMLQNENSPFEEVKNGLSSASNRLLNEIERKQLLYEAATGQIEPTADSVSLPELLNEIASGFGREFPTNSVQITGESGCNDHLWSDRGLLRRILEDLVKNALEVTAAGGIVMIQFSLGSEAVIECHIEGAMHLEDRNHISTLFPFKKDIGRGTGTDCIKLLAERYLRGRISFSSASDSGTLFRLTLPLDIRISV